MLNSIINIKKELSNSFKYITKERERSEIFKGKNADAGAELLSRFRGMYSGVKDATIENIYKAKNVGLDVEVLHAQIVSRCSAIGEFDRLFHALPSLCKEIDEITLCIDDLGNKCLLCEEQLDELDNLIIQKNDRLRKQLEIDKIELLKEDKHIQIEKLKGKLSRELAHTTAIYEMTLREKLNFKRREMADTYDLEIDAYRRTGLTSLKPDVATTKRLSDIDLDYDTNSLEAYLNEGNNDLESEDVLAVENTEEEVGNVSLGRDNETEENENTNKDEGNERVGSVNSE